MNVSVSTPTPSGTGKMNNSPGSTHKGKAPASNGEESPEPFAGVLSGALESEEGVDSSNLKDNAKNQALNEERKKINNDPETPLNNQGVVTAEGGAPSLQRDVLGKNSLDEGDSSKIKTNPSGGASTNILELPALAENLTASTVTQTGGEGRGALGNGVHTGAEKTSSLNDQNGTVYQNSLRTGTESNGAGANFSGSEQGGKGFATTSESIIKGVEKKSTSVAGKSFPHIVNFGTQGAANQSMPLMLESMGLEVGARSLTINSMNVSNLFSADSSLLSEAEQIQLTDNRQFAEAVRTHLPGVRSLNPRRLEILLQTPRGAKIALHLTNTDSGIRVQASTNNQSAHLWLTQELRTLEGLDFGARMIWAPAQLMAAKPVRDTRSRTGMNEEPETPLYSEEGEATDKDARSHLTSEGSDTFREKVT